METVTPEFKEWPKIARLRRGMVVTEKIDGTNAQIYVPEDASQPLLAGSRTRWLAPGKGTDNYGFAAWVKEHESELRQLGPGRHYGEWYGSGIQRTYGLTEKRLALFNTARWLRPEVILPSCVGVVPLLFTGDFDTTQIDRIMEKLDVAGSVAVPGFMKPEGIVVFHVASGTLYKRTFERDEKPKSQAA